MNPSDFIDVLIRLLKSLRSAQGKELSRPSRISLRAIVGAWFSEYRVAFLGMLGDEALLRTIDELMQAILKLAGQEGARLSRAIRLVSDARKQFADQLLVPLSRAYWSRA